MTQVVHGLKSMLVLFLDDFSQMRHVCGSLSFIQCLICKRISTEPKVLLVSPWPIVSIAGVQNTKDA